MNCPTSNNLFSTSGVSKQFKKWIHDYIVEQKNLEAHAKYAFFVSIDMVWRQTIINPPPKK